MAAAAQYDQVSLGKICEAARPALAALIDDDRALF